MRIAVAAISMAWCVACTAHESAPSSTARALAGGARDAGDEPPVRGVSVVRFDDLGMSCTIPHGWRAVGDDAIARTLRQSAERDAPVLADRIERKKGVPLLALRSADGTMTFLLNVVDVPRGTLPLEALKDQQKKLSAAFAEWALVEAPHALSSRTPAGAEMTDEHLLRARDGREARVRVTLRMFLRGGQAFLLSVMWPALKGARPEEASTILDGVKFDTASP